jgi:hypothetical protein
MLERAFGRRQDSFEIDDRLARLLDYVIRDLGSSPPIPDT